MKNRVHDTPFASSTSPRRHKAKSSQLLLSAGVLEVPRASSQRERCFLVITRLWFFFIIWPCLIMALKKRGAESLPLSTTAPVPAGGTYINMLFACTSWVLKITQVSTRRMHVFGKLWFIDSKQITEQIMRLTRLSTCSKLTRRVLERSLAFVESERYANGVERENQENVLYVRIRITIRQWD